MITTRHDASLGLLSLAARFGGESIGRVELCGDNLAAYVSANRMLPGQLRTTP